MLLEIPVETIVREISLCLYGILIFIEFGIAFFFWNAYRKNRERDFIGAIGMFFGFMALGRVLLVVFDYYLTMMDYNLYEANFTFYKIAVDLQAIGLGFFLYIAERSLLHGNDKYIFLIGYSLCQFLATIILDFNLSQSMITVAGLFVLFIPISYIYTAIKAKGPFRTQLLFIISGVAFFSAGTLLLGESVMGLLEPLMGSRYAVHILTVILKIIGFALLYYGFRQQLSK